jgi:hypothetical protein
MTAKGADEAEGAPRFKSALRVVFGTFVGWGPAWRGALLKHPLLPYPMTRQFDSFWIEFGNPGFKIGARPSGGFFEHTASVQRLAGAGLVSVPSIPDSRILACDFSPLKRFG